MIRFRNYLVHVTNLRNSIFLCYKIDNKIFCSSSYFTFGNSIGNLDTCFKAQLTYPIGIVNSPLLKEHKGVQKSICQKKRECSSTYKSTYKHINKQLSHFETSSLFVRNHYVIKNNVRHMSSFSEQHSSPFMRNTGLLKTISESAPVEFMQDLLVWLHSYTGLPWWATIILTTIAIRTTITLPLFVYQNYIFAKITNLKYEMDDIVFDLKRKTKASMDEFNWPDDFAKKVYERDLKKHWNQLIIKENCHPLKGVVLVIVQIPMWITLSFALRNLCSMLPNYSLDAYQTYMEMTTGGFGWMLNLTEADHLFIIPASLSLLNLAIIEVQATMRLKEPTRMQKGFTNFFRFVSVLMIPISAYIPSSVCLYWMTSSACGLSQHLLLLSPKFRRLVGIPETDIDLSNPYRHLCEQMKNKFNLGLRTTKR